MIQLGVPTTDGRTFVLADLIDALVAADLPPDVYVSRDIFRLVLERIPDGLVKRDDRGVYLDVVRCHIRLGASPSPSNGDE